MITAQNPQPLSVEPVIVVLDRNPASLRRSEQVLTASGYWDLRLCCDVDDVLDQVSGGAVGLVVCDIAVPDLGGHDVLGLIKDAVPEDEFLPILVVTSNGDEATRRQVLDVGADDFLVKPINALEMVLRIRHLLELRGLHNALSESRRELAATVQIGPHDRDTAMQCLRNLVKSKDAFLASVGHELRTPLTAVLGFADELTNNAKRFSRREVAELAEVIAVESAHLSQLIDNLLIAARLGDNSTAVVKGVEVDVNKELRVIVQGMAKVDQSRIEMPNRRLRVSGNHLLIRQILRNLIGNALRHGGDRIIVELSTDSGIGTVTIVDNGPARSEEPDDRLFERYANGSSDASQQNSIGLGLPVSRFLARRMDGNVKSVSRPQGTAFELSLPVVSRGRRGAM